MINTLGKGEVNPLMVPLLENVPSQKEIAANWFSRNVFTDADEREDLRYDDSEDEMHVDVQENTIEDPPKQPIGPKKTLSKLHYRQQKLPR